MILGLLDFETLDLYLKNRKLGAGWPYGLNVPDSDFKVLGGSMAVIDTDTKNFIELPVYHKNDSSLKDKLQEFINRVDGIVGHNLSYDLGCLEYLRVVYEHKDIYDTLIIAKLYCNEIRDFSLDSLSKLFLAKEYRKKKNVLVESAIKHRLIKSPKEGCNLKLYNSKAERFCYDNLDKIQAIDFEAVAEYCNFDLVATGHLFFKLVDTSLPRFDFPLSRSKYVEMVNFSSHRNFS